MRREEREMDLLGGGEYENTRGEGEGEKWKRMWQVGGQGKALFYFNGAVSRPEPPLALHVRHSNFFYTYMYVCICNISRVLYS